MNDLCVLAVCDADGSFSPNLTYCDSSDLIDAISFIIDSGKDFSFIRCLWRPCSEPVWRSEFGDIRSFSGDLYSRIKQARRRLHEV